MLLVVLLEQSGTAETAWNKCWDSLDRPSQLGTLLGELRFWDNWTVLSSTVQVRVGHSNDNDNSHSCCHHHHHHHPHPQWRQWWQPQMSPPSDHCGGQHHPHQWRWPYLATMKMTPNTVNGKYPLTISSTAHHWQHQPPPPPPPATTMTTTAMANTPS